MTTMNPETRRLIKVMPEDAERTAHYFDVLLGDGSAGAEEFHCGKRRQSIWNWRIFPDKPKPRLCAKKKWHRKSKNRKRK